MLTQWRLPRLVQTSPGRFLVNYGLPVRNESWPLTRTRAPDLNAAHHALDMLLTHGQVCKPVSVKPYNVIDKSDQLFIVAFLGESAFVVGLQSRRRAATIGRTCARGSAG
jgi:hypothetical protein